MMVLRHVGPPSATVVSHEEISQNDDRPPIPMDLSNKHVHSTSPEIPRHLTRNPFLSIIPSTIRPLSSPHTPPNPNHINNINNNNNNNNNNVINNNNIGSKSNSSHSSNSEENSPRGKGESWRLRKSDLSEVRWRDVNVVQSRNEDDINSHSSPDSGLHRDSPGEDEDITSSKAPTPPLSLSAIRKPQTLIPLSIIRARYSHNSRLELPIQNDDESSCPIKSGRPPDQVLTKRARLEEMVTNIKSSKDRSRRNSGEDDTSSGGHVTSSDEVAEDGPTDLRNSLFNQSIISKENGGGCLNLKRKDLNEDEIMEDEPCNLVCPKTRLRNRTEELQFDAWKNNNKLPSKLPNQQPMSPTEAAKMLGVDPETYQQQMMQFQLTQAAMLGDPGGLLKAMGPYPPWVYLGYYSQLLHSFQAQEILRQYAMQSNPLTPNVSQGDKSPSVPRTLGSSGYNCQSPLSPASLSEGPAGVDSDGSIVGQSTSGNNGKRAPRAMTGRHVRTGTGASPATLQTLRQKIEERQRIKAQQARNDLLNQPNSKIKNNKYSKKPNNKK